VDEWSGDRGWGAPYLSQQCVFRLAPKAGIKMPDNMPDAEKLKLVQERLEADHEGALQIWQSMGIYMGYTIAHYADFYELKHVLVLGRCTSGRGGNSSWMAPTRCSGPSFQSLPHEPTFSCRTKRAGAWDSPSRPPACRPSAADGG